MVVIDKRERKKFQVAILFVFGFENITCQYCGRCGICKLLSKGLELKERNELWLSLARALEQGAV